MKKLISWISQILRDERGNPSSKRVVGVLAGLSLCVTLIMNQFTDIAIAPSDTLVNAVAALAFGALGLSSADKIWGKLQGKEEAKAKDSNYKRRLPLFIGEKDNATFYIVPVRGKGLWDAIWGYVSLDKDLVVEGVFFDHAGETPGLGSNIKERFFMDDFKGEHILDGETFKGIDVAKGNSDPKNNDKTDNEVDAIAGATITGNGLAVMLKKDLQLYLPYLKTLKK